MQFVADLHLHSKYARAVSKDMVLPIMAQYARQKGINLVSAPDWTHTLWFKEIRTQLEEKTEGLYGLKGEKGSLFLLATEISSIYSQEGKVRRIHNLVFAPNFEVAEKINKELIRRGCNLLSDGRPIVGISSRNLIELILSISDKAMLIPCHVWTPHFGVYGSASGFDSLDEAFGEYAQYIYGIETGLSSDPEMNWQMWELKYRSILSFSDAHSPAKMGREATVFVTNGEGESDMEITYHDITAAIRKERNGKLKIGYTIEFYPEEGKYHFSGHRNCKVVFGPEDIKAKGNMCPACKRKMTEGVLFRVQQLGNPKFAGLVEEKTSPHGIKWYTHKEKKHPPYVKLVPLLEIVAESLGSSVASQKTKTLFADVCRTFGSEIDVLLKTPIEKIQSMGNFRLAEGIRKVRLGQIAIDPGYDGEYGKVKIWNDESKKKASSKKESSVVKSQLGLGF